MDTLTVATPAPPKYAGFWRRFNAYGIDTSILWVVCVVLQILAGDMSGIQQVFHVFGALLSGTLTPELGDTLVGSLTDSMSGGSILGADTDLMIVLSSLYNIFFVHSVWQATPGKHWLNCKVVNADGSRLTLQQSALRHAMTGISAVAEMVPCITIFWSKEKLAPHDMICHTRVVMRESAT